jgi:hypothetical protein
VSCVALRPAVTLDDLASAEEASASAILSIAARDGASLDADWSEMEASMAGRGDGAAAPPAIVRARQWLLAGGARLESVHRRRRVAVSVGGTVGAGELERVWIAIDGEGRRRAVVGMRDREPSDRRVEIERLAAARAFGLPDGAVAALALGSEPALITATERSR